MYFSLLLFKGKTDWNRSNVKKKPADRPIRKPTITTLKFLEPCPQSIRIPMATESTTSTIKTPKNTEINLACESNPETPRVKDDNTDCESVIQTNNKYAALFQKCDECLEKDPSYQGLMKYVQRVSETKEIMDKMYSSLDSFDTRIAKNRPRAAHPGGKTPHAVNISSQLSGSEI